MTDWTGLPGGGILIPGDLIYAYIGSAGLTNVVTLYHQMYYTLIDIDDRKAAELMGMLFPANM